MNPKSILNIHQVCQKFHALANLHPHHRLKLSKILATDENIELSRKSSRLYEVVKLYEFDLSRDKLTHCIDFLRHTGYYVKRLNIAVTSLDKTWIGEFLKLFPNLEFLKLRMLKQTEELNQEIQQTGQIKLPKLKEILLDRNAEGLDLFLGNVIGCNVTNLLFDLTFHSNTVPSFIKTQEKSLKDLRLWNYDNAFVGADWNFLTDLKELRLEKLDINAFNVDSMVLMSILRQNASTMKSLDLWRLLLTDEMLDEICESLKNLESLNLLATFSEVENGLLGLHKLKNLKQLSLCIFRWAETFTLEGLATGINENLLEICAPFTGITSDVISSLGISLPNLRKLRMDETEDVSQVKDVLQSFRKLEELNIYHEDLEDYSMRLFNGEEEYFDDIYYISGKILDCINEHGKGLKRVSISGYDDLEESFIREKLKDLKGLEYVKNGMEISTIVI